MGLKAESQLTTNSQTVHVKALLESHELILRGAVKKTLPINELSDPRAVNGQLLFEHGGRPYALTLPDGQAAKWLKKLTTEPPSLARKLGVDGAHKAFVRGPTDDPALAEALQGATTDDPHQAVLAIAVATSPEGLSASLAKVINILPAAPLWIVYPKGAKSPLPESAVRSHLRALGFADTKACAVSETLTATRFHRTGHVATPHR
ncbi:MAG TPA: hypothetical protein VG839_09325 [Asticcacaulis sp.]|nr:hypothetical protein [Asticcacaulis sp.]